MKKTISAFACAVIYMFWCGAQPPVATTSMGVISGTVKGDDGSTIASGLVSASGTPYSPKSRLARTSATTPIVSDGTFHLPPLSAGTYQICVQTKTAAWLDPCQWGFNKLTVSLSPGQAVASVNLVLNKGALVTVRLIDPTQALSANEGKAPGAHLLLGVTTDTILFRSAVPVSQDAAGRNYQLLIPFDRKISVAAVSSFFQLADATGKALPKSNLIPVLVPWGQPPPTLALTVTGVARP